MIFYNPVQDTLKLLFFSVSRINYRQKVVCLRVYVGARWVVWLFGMSCGTSAQNTCTYCRKSCRAADLAFR